MNKTLEKGTIV